ncbi:hypothetical protein MLD38_016726 [Melastoma candidum]|uniref:Uncharacterized protein n=1 Tax=Melastoma candidum TaxID=119954 RepID=A0ACB9QPL6_9MYRT|nr:hypothetical protein MLD38_016726 [Melastoma candidum]
MAAIKLFGTTIAVECPVRDDRDRKTGRMAMAAATTTTTTTTTTSTSSSSSDRGAAEERAKKPDKIIPCPRCRSMETKFCYFNNYNVNQPRHFCKGCQRYWTSGGALRNVPVGAGRRKSKPPTPTPHQPCRAGDLGYDEDDKDWGMAEQGGLGLQQHLIRIKRRRTSDFHSDHDQCY